MNDKGKLTSLLNRYPVDSRLIVNYARFKQLDCEELVKLALVYSQMNHTQKFSSISLLHLASVKCKPDVVSILLKEGWEVNLESDDAGSPLHVAMDSGNVPVGRLLIEAGADINRRSSGDITPLGAAISTNKREKSCVSSVKLLLEAGVSVNSVVDFDGQDTALHVAVANNLASVVSLLLQKGADINAVNLKRVTPLLYAIYYGYIDIVKLLILHEPDFYKEDLLQHTPMITAVKEKQNEIIEILANGGCDLNKSTSCNFNSPLHSAAIMNDVGMVKLLLSLKADPNKAVIGNLTSLHIVCKKPPIGHIFYETIKVEVNARKDIIEALIESGAKVDAVTDDKITPLQSAVECGLLSVAKLLIKVGADIHVPALYDSIIVVEDTLFHQVVLINRDIIMNFLEYGADFNVCNGNGLTPYHVAIAKTVDLKFIKGFLRYGCPYNQNPPLFSTIMRKCNRSIEQFFTAEKKFFHGIKENNLKLVKNAVEQGAVARSTSEEIKYPLHLLAFKGHKEVLSFLLEQNVPPNSLNEKGQSVLYVAAKYGHYDICYSLLKYGACYNYTSEECAKTPFIAASEYKHKQVTDLLGEVERIFNLSRLGRKRLINELYSKFKNNKYDGRMYLNVVNRRGDTLLATAVRKNHQNIIREIMKLRFCPDF